MFVQAIARKTGAAQRSGSSVVSRDPRTSTFHRAALRLCSAAALFTVGLLSCGTSAARAQSFVPPIVTTATTTLLSGASGSSNIGRVGVDKAGDVFYIDHSSNTLFEIPAASPAVTSTAPVALVTGIGAYNSEAAFVDPNGNLWVANGNGSASVAGSTEYIGLLEIPAGPNGLPNVAALAAGETVAQMAAVNCSATTTTPCVWQDNAFATNITNYYSQPSDVAADAAGNVFFTDYNGGNIISFNTATPATGTKLAAEPTKNVAASIAVDGAGKVYYCDSASSVYGAGGSGKVSLVSGGALTTVGTTSTLGAAMISSCLGVASDRYGNLFINGLNSSNAQQLSEVPFEGTALNFTDEFGILTPLTPASVYAGSLDQNGNFYYAGSTSITQVQINSYNFGNVPVGTTVSATSTPAAPSLNLYVNVAPSSSISSYFPTGSPVTNTSAAYLQSFPFSGTKSFAGGSSFAAGTNYTITMNFQPVHPGLLKGSYTPRANGADATVVNLQGNGIGPLPLFFPGTPSLLFNKTTGTSPVTLNAPQGVAVDSYGDIFVADTGNGKVVADCLATTTQAEDGTGGSTSNSFCSESGNNSQPTYTGTIQAVGGTFVAPAAVAVDGAQSVYVVDSGAGGVPLSVINGQSTATSATPLISATAQVGGKTLSGPMGVAVDGYANVYVADTGNNRIIQAHQYGAAATDNIVLVPSTTKFGGTALNAPHGLAVDQFQNLYIADTGNNRIVEFTRAAVASVVTVTGVTLGSPYAVAVYPSGALAVTDNTNGLVYIAPGGAAQVLGFGATYTTTGARGVALDPFGNIILSNTGGNQVLELNVTSPTVTFPNTNSGSISPTSTTTVTDAGNASLVLSSLATSSNNFAIDNSSTCTSTSTVAANGTCNLVLKFSPQSVGPLTGTVTLTDNALSYTLNNSGSNQTATFATSGTQTVNLVGQATSSGSPQSITFPALATPITYSTTPIPLAATASSGLPVTFSVLSGPGSITGTATAPTLTVNGVGTIVVAADQPGSALFRSAPEVTQSIVVTQASQTITFTAASPVPYSTTTPVPLSASASSGLPVTFTVTGPATLTGTATAPSFTINGLGTVVVTANQAGNANYAAAAPVQQSIVISPLGTVAAPAFVDANKLPILAGTYNIAHPPAILLTDATPNAAIYYTTDGTTPIPGVSQLYTPTIVQNGGILVNSSETVKAIAVENGYVASPVTTEAFVIDTGTEDVPLTLSANSLSLGLGQSGTLTVTITPVQGINAPVTLTCTGLPIGATCSFNPNPVSTTAAQTPVTDVLTVTAPTTLSMLEQRGRSLLPETTLALAVCLFGWRKRRNLRLGLLLAVSAVCLTWISGCGGATNSETSTVTVTAAGDYARTSQTFQLTIHK